MKQKTTEKQKKQSKLPPRKGIIVKGDGLNHAWISAWFDFDNEENHL